MCGGGVAVLCYENCSANITDKPVNKYMEVVVLSTGTLRLL